MSEEEKIKKDIQNDLRKEKETRERQQQDQQRTQETRYNDFDNSYYDATRSHQRVNIDPHTQLQLEEARL